MIKRKMEKRRQTISASWFSYPQYAWQLSMYLQNLKTLALIAADKSVTKHLEKTKMDK